MEQIEKQFITSYLFILAKEGKEICKEVESIFNDNDELMVEKAYSYSLFLFNSEKLKFNPKLVERCKKYLDDMSSYKLIKHTFEQVNINRKIR